MYMNDPRWFADGYHWISTLNWVPEDQFNDFKWSGTASLYLFEADSSIVVVPVSYREKAYNTNGIE